MCGPFKSNHGPSHSQLRGSGLHLLTREFGWKTTKAAVTSNGGTEAGLAEKAGVFGLTS
jgi:hypothetical protein